MKKIRNKKNVGIRIGGLGTVTREPGRENRERETEK